MAKQRHMRRLLEIVSAVATLALGSGAQPVTAGGMIQIVAAENFYGDLAAQIGGNHVAVTSILANPDEDPHLFESTPSTARTLATADIILYNGAGYDAWMERLLSAGGTPGRTTLVAADIAGRTNGDNPHVWYDPATFPAVAAALATELAKRDPADAAEFSANLEGFDQSFAAATADVAAIRAAHAGTKVTATEPVFGYMVAAMGLDMLNQRFQLATMNETVPSASDVAAFEDSLKSGSVKVMFYNSQVTDDTTMRLLDLARLANVPLVGVTETMPAGQTIQSWFAAQLAAVAAALGNPK
jgi:zinc/manganese transport system substrate-binding protein